ncbi:TPA: ATP-grasp fold amidoligase family protein [Klebsiella aerogenes]
MKTYWQYEYLRYLLRVFRHGFRSDRSYRIRKFERDFGFSPNLSFPQTFNEKVLYRMINPSRVNLFTQLADKLKAREYVGKINRDLLTEVYGIFDNVENIDTYCFPEKFVLKCNHDTGSFLICKAKNSFDLERAKSNLSLHMKMNMYYRTREWQYRKIKPLVFCEEYIDRSCMMFSGVTPDVFRFHCFDSCALFVEVEFIDDEKK